MAGDLFTSIDVGTRSTKGVVMEIQDGNKYIIHAHTEIPSRGIEKGDVKDVNAFKECLNAAFEDLESQFPKIDKSFFLLSFSSDKYILESLSHRVELSQGEEGEEVVVTEDMIKTLEEEAKRRISEEGDGYKIYHFYPKRYVINDTRMVYNPVDMKAKSLAVEFSAVKIDYETADMIEAIVQDLIGYECIFFASPVTGSEGVLTSTEKDSGVVVIDIGHEFTTVVAYLNGSPIDLRIVPVGVRHVIRDIAYVLATSNNEAERLLKTYGSASYDIHMEEGEIEYRALDGRTLKRIPEDKFFMIINARVNEILNKSRRIIKDLERKVQEYRENGIPGGVVLIGGGAKIKGIVESATENFKTNVRIGNFVTSLTEGQVIEGKEEFTNDPAASAVFGNVIEAQKELYGEIQYTTPKKFSFFKALFRFLKELF